MIMEKVVALLLLLQLIVCSDTQTPQSLCKGEICHVFPDSFSYLGQLIYSNRIIKLNRGEYSFNRNNGFILIENVSNLTISGEESLSVIECTPNSIFGFHLLNVTNVTLSGLTIRKCSFTDRHIRKTTILVEVSTNVRLSGFSINYSSGQALTIIGRASDVKPLLLNLRLIDCVSSYNQEGSVVVFGRESLLLERVILANSATGIVTFSKSDIMIKNVDVNNCTNTYFHAGGQITVVEQLALRNSSMSMKNVLFHIRSGRVFLTSISVQKQCLVTDRTQLLLTENALVEFKSCGNVNFGTSSSVELNNSTLVFGQNENFIAQLCHLDMKNGSSLMITNNSMGSIYFESSRWTMGSDSKVSVINNIDSIVNLFSMSSVHLNGLVTIANNSNIELPLDTFGIVNSIVKFRGRVQVSGNRGGTGLTVFNSELYFYNTANFSDNHSIKGGAITLISSVMYISLSATVDFTNNYAKYLGGAIYIEKPRPKYLCGTADFSCSIRVLESDYFSRCRWFNITFNNNKAGVAGNAIYGGYTFACVPSDNCLNCPLPKTSSMFALNEVNNSSDLSKFTSDPTRVCFCEEDIPNCVKILDSLSVHPGEHFSLSLAIVGYGLGTVPGSVIARTSNESAEKSIFGSEFEVSQQVKGTKCQNVVYSILSERHQERFALMVEAHSSLWSLGRVESSVKYSDRTSGLREAFLHIPVFVDVDLLPCPIGFQLVRGKCVCDQVLLDNNVDTCSFSNGTALILRPTPYWIGLQNDTNSSILIHPHCPYDYCQSDDINITAESSNTQCQYQRSGVLCGSCEEGLSMILGSSECKTCSNPYLGSVGLFVLAGIALVAIVSSLNMTVSVGTINGLIFFANILQANKTVFLPPPLYRTHVLVRFLRVFIAWLNLDLGIPMCFFDGLTTYVKTWLQFVFPLYILVLVCCIIVASNYSMRVTRLLGTNTASVLATLVLLSYAKILRILITAFSFTTITGSQGYHSVVWLADGNIEYFEPKHVILFLVALLVLLLLGIPCTVTLTAAPWIQRSTFKWVSFLYNKFKPLFDAYMGPYKDNCRYWTGMLLLARVVLIVLFSSISNTNTVAGPQLNLLLLIITSCALLALTVALKPYKTRVLNGLEIFHLAILFIISSSNLYVLSIGTGVVSRAYFYIFLVGICFLVFLGIVVGHIWYKVRKTRAERRSEPQPKRQEEEQFPQWQRARVKAEDEDTDAKISETGASSAISSETTGALKYRESSLELLIDTQ